MAYSNSYHDLPFEQAIEELELLVSKMEEGKTSLSQTLKMFEEGIKLTQYCQSQLNQTEQSIQKLTQQTLLNNQQED